MDRGGIDVVLYLFHIPAMSFWAYILHCRGGKFYAGHTDNLEKRIGEHQSGIVEGFTRDHLPVKLVWTQEFPTRYEALRAERQIKGWSRAKKMALIRGDWDLVSKLAKSKKPGPPEGNDRALPPHPQNRSP